MSLSSITIETFRGIKDATFDNIKRVNYVVGKNNSGKTSVLEAVVAGGCYSNIDLLIDTIFSRSQKILHWRKRIFTIFRVSLWLFHVLIGQTKYYKY